MIHRVALARSAQRVPLCKSVVHGLQTGHFVQNSRPWQFSEGLVHPMSSKSVVLLCWVVISSVITQAALADVYKFVGRNGQVIYTDSPRNRGYKLVIKSPEPEIKPVTISLGAGRRLGPAPPEPLFSRPMSGNPPGATMPAQFSKSTPVDVRRMQFANVIEAAAYRHGLEPALLHAVIRAESSYNPGAVSNKGAMGLMQLMPGTAARYGVRNPYDPQENIFGGAKYLRDLMGMFRSDVRLAVAAYNAGEHNVMKYGYQVPPFQETRDYVTKVLGYYSRFN